jgi:Lrp/AsnC family transcriptional regulator for asnA, asnC and gidA
MLSATDEELKIDETDCRILAILEQNGRTPNNEIAGRLNLSEGTVRNRIKKLTSNNFLKIQGLTNVNKRTDKQLLFILVKLITTKHWEKSARQVAALPNVRSVSMITGRFDLIVEIYIEPHNLINFLTNDLTSVETIGTSESLAAIKTFGKWI